MNPPTIAILVSSVFLIPLALRLGAQTPPPNTIVHLTDVYMRPDFDAPLTKEIACSELAMSARYYTFDKLGWRFVMLDGKGSYHETPPGNNIIKLSASDVISVTYTRYPNPFIDHLPGKATPPKP